MRIVLTGYGKMGRMVEDLARQKGWEILATVDRGEWEKLQMLERADVAIDFSHPAMLEPLADYVRRTGTPLLSGTTGLNEVQMDRLRQLGAAAPVLYAANYSLGIALLRRMLEQFGPALRADFDVELVEKHHNQKADAPSGTAKLLADALDPEHTLRRVTGREGFCGARGRDEMGMFAVRGGTVAGEHTLYFFGEDETLTLTHSAASRRIFAAGAMKAAQLLAKKMPGFYTLDEVLFSKSNEERMA
ncbi:MAG: 4-hydroxy-tetrahydrodipicolinate reductase [Oscillospiraceae bacterium]|nr:4-hydroxy-tetrahydrodipicolinate reductase [Oscillospiraceae bacterium]